MIELLISIMITLGINFTTSDYGKLIISQQDSSKLESSDLFNRTDFNGAIEDVVVTTGVDPSSASTSHE